MTPWGALHAHAFQIDFKNSPRNGSACEHETALHANTNLCSNTLQVDSETGLRTPPLQTCGETRVVRPAAGERERRRARKGWTSRAMRREGVVAGRGGSGVEVNNGGVVGAN